MEIKFRGRETREFKKFFTAEILKDTKKDLARMGEYTEPGYKMRNIKPF